jgi:hypothetical protein
MLKKMKTSIGRIPKKTTGTNARVSASLVLDRCFACLMFVCRPNPCESVLHDNQSINQKSINQNLDDDDDDVMQISQFRNSAFLPLLFA